MMPENVTENKKKPLKLPSYSQSLKLPNELHQRAIKYEKRTGLSIPEQLRSALNEFLTIKNH